MSGVTYSIKKESTLTFSFISEGPKGSIAKIVKYERITPELYNLGFGDQVGNSLEFDDTSVTGNRDTVKVMATVISTLSLFFKRHPEKSVFITGSTPVRTRLYQRIITNYFDSLSQEYHIEAGARSIPIEPFAPDKDYEYFVVSKKAGL